MKGPRATDRERSRLLIDCARLGAGVVDRVDVAAQCALEEPGLVAARVADGLVDVDVVVRAAGSTFVADGWLRGKWISECRRCLAEMEGQLEVALSEVFEWEPSEGETWPISDYRIDLGPPAREAAILALPLAPLCSEDCAGPEPVRFPTGPVGETRSDPWRPSG